MLQTTNQPCTIPFSKFTSETSNENHLLSCDENIWDQLERGSGQKIRGLGIWVCLKIGKTPKPNGFADHYPVFKWLFYWED